MRGRRTDTDYIAAWKKLKQFLGWLSVWRDSQKDALAFRAANKSAAGLQGALPLNQQLALRAGTQSAGRF